MRHRVPRKHLNWRTPFEVLTGQTPNVAYLRIFGCRAWVHNKQGKKLDAKALPMTFVGYKPGSKAYCLWNPQTHKVIVSSDVTFDEQTFPHRLVPKPETPVTEKELRVLNPQPEGKQVQFIEVPALVFEAGNY